MKGKPIGCEGKIELHTGDVYIMSEKAVGYDTWAKPWILTLRHAAGKTTGTTRERQARRDWVANAHEN